MSEAAFRSAEGLDAPTFTRPSTPHCLRTVPLHGHPQGMGTKNPLASQVVEHLNGCSRELDPQITPTSLQCNQKETTAKTHVMRGVITGPARWRGSSVFCGTPSLYCAVYSYSLTPGDACSGGSPAQLAGAPSCADHCLPPPKLLSSTWGQGPLVIENVPVPERQVYKQGEVADHQLLCRGSVKSAYVSCLFCWA